MINRVHKWLAVPIGVFLLLWLISGIVMLLPSLSTGPVPLQRARTVDFRDAQISPAQAIANLESAFVRSSTVKSLNVKHIQGVVAYEIQWTNGETHLVSAVSGRVFAVSADLAKRLVLESYPRNDASATVARVEKHSYAYQWGPLPAYRVVFENEPTVDFFVAANDGTIRRIDSWNRVQGALGSLHTFEPLKLMVKQDSLRTALLMLLSSLGIVVAVSGYYLALGSWRRSYGPLKNQRS